MGSGAKPLPITGFNCFKADFCTVCSGSCTIKSAIRSERGKTLLGQLKLCKGLVGQIEWPAGKFATALYGKNAMIQRQTVVADGKLLHTDELQNSVERMTSAHVTFNRLRP